MTDDLLSSASVLFAPDHVIEVRVITDDGMASGYFDSHQELAAKVSVLDSMANVQGIYVTLNEVNPSLLSRRANRIKMRLTKKDVTTADADIIRRRWFPVDIDPVRPSGVSSTGEEHQAAIEKAVKVAAFLAEDHGWPKPVLADSGNGAHLLYRIDLPNDPGSHDLVRHGLETLSTIFSDSVASIDTANHNAARIWKLYGTVSRKGDNTRSRPHRRSRIIDAPGCIGMVSRAQLERLSVALPIAPVTPAAARSQRSGLPKNTLNLSEWLSEQGIEIASQKPYEGGTLYNLVECPFSDTHTDGAFAIQFPNGGIFAGCHHASCGGSRKQHWGELRGRYQPGAGGERKNTSRPRPPGGPPPAPSFCTMAGFDEATALLEHGDPKGGMLNAFALDHEGDETAAECLIMSLASRSVINTNGLHVSVTGESGKGKSHTFTTMLKQVPERFRISGAMSNKALFYMEGLQPGMSIVLDDTSLSEDMSGILKGVTTSFRKPFLYRTVNKDRKGQVCTIPERCIWWVAKVEGSGDDQVFNRMLTCWIDDSPGQDDRVLTRVLEQSRVMPQDTEDRPQVVVCRAMWELIGAERLYVVIPFADKIRFQTNDNRRNPEMLLDLIKSNAVIRFRQRERADTGGVPCIVATRDDFNDAIKLYGLLNGTTGGQTTKLTKKESDLVITIEKGKWPEFTIPMLQKATGLSNSAIHKLMHGYASRGATYTGLLEKCPAISFTDRTVVSADEYSGFSTRRRTNAYTFDQSLFQAWSLGGTVWMDGDGPGGDGPNPPAMLQPFRTTSAAAAGHENNRTPTDPPVQGTSTHICVNDSLSFCNSENIECVQDSHFHTHHALYDCGIAEGIDQKSIQKTPILNLKLCESENTLLHVRNDAERQPGIADRGEGVTISSRDYKVPGHPEYRTTCSVCGHRGTGYIEKLTPERKARKDKTARRICRKCFETAMRSEQARAPPLPGIIVPGRMVRITKDLGRCSVCNLGKAEYLDRETGTSICQQCYDREKPGAAGLSGGGAGQ